MESTSIARKQLMDLEGLQKAKDVAKLGSIWISGCLMIFGGSAIPLCVCTFDLQIDQH